MTGAPYNYYYFDYISYWFTVYGNIRLYGSGDISHIPYTKHIKRAVAYEEKEDRRKS